MDSTTETPEDEYTREIYDLVVVENGSDHQDKKCWILQYPDGTIPAREDALDWIRGILDFYDCSTDNDIADDNRRTKKQRDEQHAEFWRKQDEYIAASYADTILYEDQHRKGFVYILEGQGGAYKIGRTFNPHERLKSWQTKMPYPPAHLHTIACENCIKAEIQLHKMYAEKRVNGEWFALNAEDVAYLKAIDTISVKGIFNE